jgi:DNA-binding NarL/FixJ family response regulator
MNESYREAIQFFTDVVTDLSEENERLKRQLAGRGRPSNAKKLSAREVENIRSMHRAGYKTTEIARSFDVNHGTISRTVRGLYHA